MALLLFAVAEPAFAAETSCQTTGIQVCIPVEPILFAATLAGVALFHRHTLAAAAIGLVVISAFKLHFTGFEQEPVSWG